MAELGKIIDYLKTQDSDKKVKSGFGAPHSYRGYYDQVAFEPVANTTVGTMLAHAESAIGPVFTGYKGGDYVYNRFTPAWIAVYGRCGDELSVAKIETLVSQGDELTKEKQISHSFEQALLEAVALLRKHAANKVEVRKWIKRWDSFETFNELKRNGCRKTEQALLPNYFEHLERAAMIPPRDQDACNPYEHEVAKANGAIQCAWCKVNL
jgi:hypothetical protein